MVHRLCYAGSEGAPCRHLGLRVPGGSPRHQEAPHEGQARPACRRHLRGGVRGRPCPEGRPPRGRGAPASRSPCRPSTAAARRSVQEIEAMRLLTYKAAWLIDQGTTAPIVSSYAKAFGADHAMKITPDAREADAGRQAPAGLRGDQPGSARCDCPEPPERLIRLSELTSPAERG